MSNQPSVPPPHLSVQDPVTEVSGKLMTSILTGISYAQAGLSDTAKLHLRGLSKDSFGIERFMGRTMRLPIVSDVLLPTSAAVDSSSGLGHLVNNFSQFTGLFESVKGQLELIADYWIPVLEKDYATLAKLVSEVTLTKLTLQLHCMYFASTTLLHERARSLEREELIRPVLALRNEYFAAPRASLLAEYLDLSASVASTSLYSTFSVGGPTLWRVHERIVNRHATELEVLSMLESA
jgi:hypothetical protein